MITILNRKELISTFDMKMQARVRDTLSQNGIDYTYKVVNRRSSSPVWSGTRAYTGSLGENSNLDREYVFFVKKTDYESAIALIGI